MTAKPAASVSAPASAPRSRWRRWRVGWCLLAAVFVVLGCAAWRQYDFRQAIKEAKALGWGWDYDDPIDAIHSDWTAAFRKATWTGGRRDLWTPRSLKIANHGPLIRRLAPANIFSGFGWTPDDIAAVRGIPGLRGLNMDGSRALQDVSALQGFEDVEGLSLIMCTSLTNVDGLKGLSGLQSLNLSGCTALTNVDGLAGVPALEVLDLGGCSALTNIDGLRGLAKLRTLFLAECIGLTNVDVLKGLHGLKDVGIEGCKGLQAGAVAELRAALPKTNIFPSNQE